MMNRSAKRVPVPVPVVTEAGETVEDAHHAHHAGRAPLPLDWSGVLAQQGYVFGVDISGYGERVVLADLRGFVLGRDSHVRRQGEARQPEETMSRVSGMMRDLLEGKGIRPREVLRIGVGFGGPVDARRGRVRQAHDSPGWEDFPIAAILEAAFEAPTLLDNDARLAALGEVWFGAGGGDPECHLVYVHWSTGVGGGIVAGGKLFRGATTLAGEIGHTTVRTERSDALPCRCGGVGHLEAYVREPALVQRARQAYSQAHPTDVAADAEAQAEARIPDVKALLALAEHDPQLDAFIAEAVDLMAVTIGNLITALNPSMVVVGGKVAREGAHLIPRISELARRYAMPLSTRDVLIVPAMLGEDSAVMGAVALALDSLR
jgi:glucokinase